VAKNKMIGQSERISLKYAKPGDAEALFNYTGDLATSRYLARKPHSNSEQTLTMLTQLSTPESLERHGKCVWVVCLNETDSAIGIITLVKDGPQMEIHFGIMLKFRGKGFASEALSLAASYCCSSKISNKVISFTDKQNLAAQSVLTKSGFKYTESKEAFYIAPQLSNDRRGVFNYVYSD